MNARAAALRALAALLLIVLLAAPLAGRAAATDPWTILSHSVDLTIEPDGALSIVETLEVDFDGLQKHGIFREVPVRYRYDDTRDRLYELTVRSVTDSAGRTVRYAVEDNGANRRIRVGDPDRTVSGRQGYRIAYRVAGALNAFADHDELYWNVRGSEWEVGARRVDVAVHLAGGGLSRGACFQGPKGSTETCAAQTASTLMTAAATRPLESDEDLTIGVFIAKGAVAEPTPRLVERGRDASRWFETSSSALGIALLVLAAGLWAVWRLWQGAGRDLSDGRAPTIVAEYEPPDKLRPAQIGLLLDEKADAKDLTATIVDLAVRGRLRIEEVAKTWLLGSTDWRLQRLANSTDLEPYEKTLLEGMFRTGPTVLLSDLRGDMAKTLHTAQRELYAAAVAKGWFVRNPESARGLGLGVAIAVTLAGVVLTFLLGMLAGLGLTGLAVLVVGLALLAVSPALGQRTAAGHELARRVLGFRRYIETAEKDRAAFAEREHLFTEYLPYAIVFGAVGKWAAAFAGLDATKAVSSWYVGQSAFNAMTFSRSLESFSSTVTSTIGYTPGSSGGSFSSGGFSGGGGGGGGGGSW